MTRIPSAAGLPLTVNLPARIQSSASRREASPSCASTFCTRSAPPGRAPGDAPITLQSAPSGGAATRPDGRCAAAESSSLSLESASTNSSSPASGAAASKLPALAGSSTPLTANSNCGSISPSEHSCASGGKSSRLLRLKYSRKSRVVPSSSGRPGRSRWPTTRIHCRSSSVLMMFGFTPAARRLDLRTRDGLPVGDQREGFQQRPRITLRSLRPQARDCARVLATDLNAKAPTGLLDLDRPRDVVLCQCFDRGTNRRRLRPLCLVKQQRQLAETQGFSRCQQRRFDDVPDFAIAHEAASSSPCSSPPTRCSVRCAEALRTCSGA